MELRLLGSVEARSGADPVDLGPTRQRTVLAALLMDVNRTVSADQLVARVWGDAPPQRAKDTLYAYLSRLRRLLPESAAVVRRRAGGYAVTADELAVDVHLFRFLLDRAWKEADDNAAVTRFRQALGLWRGAPFSGIDTPWFNAAREALATERFAAELECCDRRLRLGEHAALLPALSERSAAHPMDERLAAQYMLALYRSGQQADALAHYRHVRATLADELGVDPARDLQRLHEAMLAGDPDLNPPTRPAASPSADAGAPVRTETESAWAVQCQLPLDVPGFVGRAEVIRCLEQELTAAVSVPVVVSGLPGVGKTALAVHLGHRLRTAFPDGQWYAQLSDYGHGPPRDPSDVLSALLRSSGQSARDIPDSPKDRAAAYRSRLADRRLLLVLDNAVDAEQVRPLLPGTASVAVVVTSRSDLRGLTASHTARTLSLEVLSGPEAHALLAGALGEERVGAEPEAAGHLVELCDRLPLALRIAAANLASRPARSLASYTDDLTRDGRLSALSVAGDRQATVRNTFDHSYTALDPAAARLFRLLGLHPGPDFTAEAAAALLDSDTPVAERLLDVLTSAGLVQRTGADRFQFHDLLRVYAAEHAADDPERGAAWRRLCDWYLATVDAATGFEYTGSAQLPRTRHSSTRFDDQHHAAAWLEAERAVLVAVVLRTADTGPHEIAWQLADQLWVYFYARRHTAEWRATATAALRAAEAEDAVLPQAVLWNSLGLLHQHAGEPDTAREALHNAQEGYRTAGFTVGEVAIHTNLAIYHAQRGEMRTALEYQQSSDDLLRGLDRPVLLARAVNITGLIHSYLGEFDQAVDLTTEAIETARAHNRPTGTISPLVNRAWARHAVGCYADALTDATEALQLCNHHQQRTCESAVHEILARVHRDTGRLELARTHAEHALSTARRVGDPAHEADALGTLASVHHLEGRSDLALPHLQEAVALTRRCGLRHQEADTHVNLARVHLASDAVDLAAHHSEKALTLARALDLRPTEHRALTALAAIAHATSDPAKAADHMQQAQKIQEETGYQPRP
ncbi:transcriptional regulator, SARP family protein [Streptomonospora alba]|uniref:Transcriptional regulator, SARP family protein n=1 Tax=Streptomonospora alba TaxID=183763 RepID=A0A0C2G0R9_9ACTN|nr:BTAD domain-containing putative transcriptional regulator [Streptomonospora alba]KIH96913.1 transcriptional regulator, SARP family protein [Streptomonospora alba]